MSGWLTEVINFQPSARIVGQDVRRKSCAALMAAVSAAAGSLARAAVAAASTIRAVASPLNAFMRMACKLTCKPDPEPAQGSQTAAVASGSIGAVARP